MKKGLLVTLKLIALGLLVGWVIIIFIDYFQTRKDKKPLFCIKETTYNYDDGETYECIGIGYKMYRYDRDSISATEFGPIFIEQRISNEGIEKK